MKVILLKELVDGDANVGALEAVCPELAEWHRKVEPVINSEYSRNWLRELKNDRSSLAGRISDVYLSKLRKFMEKRGAWSECFLTLEMDYKLKATPEMNDTQKSCREAQDDMDLLAAYMVEVIVRRWGDWVEGHDIEVTGCRFALVADGPDAITEEQQKMAREYLASFGYPQNATTPEEVHRFVNRLRLDLYGIDNVLSFYDTPEEMQAAEEEDMQLMRAYAWRLYAERKRILADERLAGTKVNIRSGAAPASFPWPSIAAYLHFWQTDKGMIEKDGRRGLLFRVTGIAGSGTNSCNVAWEDGTSGSTGVWPFNATWSPFVKTLNQYPPKEDCGTLEELVNNLFNE